MRFPIPQIAALMLLVHMGFGCCVHHSHACMITCCEQPAVKAEACACHFHQSESDLHHNENRPPAEKEHSDKHRCEGNHCTFLRSKPSALDEPSDISRQAVEAIAGIDWLTVQQDRVHSTANDTMSVRPPTIPKHLLFSVLLI